MAERNSRDAPLVGVSGCAKQFGPNPFHAAGDKYVHAVAYGARALPLVVPALGPWVDPEDLADRIDGLMLTGSPSNVAPALYGGLPSLPGTAHDEARDGVMLGLARAAIGAGVPVLAICRGVQELNVALGGTLHQRIQELPGMLDHREPANAELVTQYGPAHPLALTRGGFFARLAGREDITVNSLHAQGIDKLADRLAIEAVAPDGLVEAVRIKGSPHFVVGVQWHPEWRFWENSLSVALFGAFGDACRTKAEARRKARRAVA